MEHRFEEGDEVMYKGHARQVMRYCDIDLECIHLRGDPSKVYTIKVYDIQGDPTQTADCVLISDIDTFANWVRLERKRAGYGA